MPDTIAAIATIQAPSAIGIVRLTGPDTRRILDGVFAPANGRPMSAQTPRKLVFGRALDRSGGVIDEDALVWALENGEIDSAGLDTFVEEPLPADHPFCKLPNVILTPHTAALSTMASIRMGVHAAQGIDEVLTGKPVTWPVNHL